MLTDTTTNDILILIFVTVNYHGKLVRFRFPYLLLRYFHIVKVTSTPTQFIHSDSIERSTIGVDFSEFSQRRGGTLAPPSGTLGITQMSHFQLGFGHVAHLKVFLFTTHLVNHGLNAKEFTASNCNLTCKSLVARDKDGDVELTEEHTIVLEILHL